MRKTIKKLLHENISRAQFTVQLKIVSSGYDDRYCSSKCSVLLRKRFSNYHACDVTCTVDDTYSVIIALLGLDVATISDEDSEAILDFVSNIQHVHCISYNTPAEAGTLITSSSKIEAGLHKHYPSRNGRLLLHNWRILTNSTKKVVVLLLT
jgi:hypothetical protein